MKLVDHKFLNWIIWNEKSLVLFIAEHLISCWTSCTVQLYIQLIVVAASNLLEFLFKISSSFLIYGYLFLYYSLLWKHRWYSACFPKLLLFIVFLWARSALHSHWLKRQPMQILCFFVAMESTIILSRVCFRMINYTFTNLELMLRLERNTLYEFVKCHIRDNERLWKQIQVDNSFKIRSLTINKTL